MKDHLASQQQQLIAQLRHVGIDDERVLSALAATPREQFVEAALQTLAYENRALGIGWGQTISQPLIVAVMTQALQLVGSERVLEIGTGSGYQTAILARLCAYVYSIERHQPLASRAVARLQRLGLTNVSIFVGDGSLGWPAKAPYERILVTAASPIIPDRLLLQLTYGGILVVPVGGREHQDLLAIRRTRGQSEIENLGGCLFVPLVGADGWQEQAHT